MGRPPYARPPTKKNQRFSNNQRKDYPGAQKYISGEITKEIQTIAKENKNITTWIIGGPNIINQTLDIIDEFYLSRIPGEYNCDTFLPLDKIEKLFDKTWSEDHGAVEFQIWKKREVY